MTTNTAPKLAYCLSVNIRRPGIKKQVSSQTDAIQTETDREMLHLSKEILDCAEYRAIVRHDAATRKALGRKTAGNSYLRQGIYMVNALGLERLITWLRERATERDELVEQYVGTEDGEVVGAYEKAREDAQVRLKTLYDPMNYPPRVVVKAAFSLTWQPFEFPSGEGLRTLSEDVLAEEIGKLKNLFAESLEESRQALRAEALGFFQRLVARLEPDEPGKKKRFHATAIDNVSTFIREFETREIANDAELREIIGKLRPITTGVDAKKIKSSENFRTALREEVAKAAEQLDKLVTTTGRRYLPLDADEDEANVA